MAGLVEKRVAMKLLGPPPPICAIRPTLNTAELEADAQRVSEEEPSPAHVCLHIDCEESRSALEDVIESATCRLDVLMFIWGNDNIGWNTARHLAAKARPELPVRVLVDGSGNLFQSGSEVSPPSELNRAVCWLADQPYVTVLRTRNPGLRLDHRKLVVADGRIAWSGGRNLVDDAFFATHDLTYTVDGPLAGRMAEVFEDAWRHNGGTARSDSPPPPPSDLPNALARVVRTTPAKREFARILYEAVEKSEHHVFVENPYFSDNHLISLLARARRRGSDVRVVLTLDSGSRIFDRSNRVTANRLLAAGVRVYLYPGKAHAKVLAVDGVWAYIGTGNFDNLSLRRNRELGLAINDGPIIAELEERLFWRDFQDEWELIEPLPVGSLEYLAEFIASTFS
jgi:cardiolipin synthase